MKRIKFTELGFKKNWNTLIVVAGIVCLIFGLIAVFGYIDSRYSGLAGFSAALTTFPQLKSYFYKNSFVWNKKGGNIKINSKSKNIVFSEFYSFEINESQLLFTKKNKTQLEFSLNEINNDDITKLKEVLEINIKK